MKKVLKKIAFLTLLLILVSCSVLNNMNQIKSSSFIENFENKEEFLTNWIDNSWKSPATYLLENKHLKITTRPNSVDRVKIRSNREFTTGTYTWRIFVPEFNLFEQVSIGAFLYHNEKEEFEFDFEIGSGKKIDREKINLKNDEAIVYCVSQFSPFNSSQYSVKMNAYSDFKMKLIDVNGFYFVKWFINNKKVKELQTKVKSNIEFKVHCSLENLFFMGDVKTSVENYVLFDGFTYQKNQL